MRSPTKDEFTELVNILYLAINQERSVENIQVMAEECWPREVVKNALKQAIQCNWFDDHPNEENLPPELE